MANTQAQFGFQPQGNIAGGAPDFQLSTASVQSTYATKIYFGDPVCYSAAASPYLIPATSTATAIVGIFQGCEFTPSTGGPPAWSPWFPGSTNSDAVAYIVPNTPSIKMRVAALLTAVTATSIGRTIAFSTGAGGTTQGGGFSTYVVDQASIGTSLVINPFKIIGLYQGIGNGSDPTTNYNWVVVGFNQLCTAAIG